MNPLLILREEIVCLVILLFLLVNALAYQTGRDSGSFLRLALCAVGHVACEILVVLAMNPPGAGGGRGEPTLPRLLLPLRGALCL